LRLEQSTKSSNSAQNQLHSAPAAVSVYRIALATLDGEPGMRPG